MSLGAQLWRVIERPQGEAFISDAILEHTNEEVLREAQVRLEAAKEVVRVLSSFIYRNTRPSQGTSE